MNIKVRLKNKVFWLSFIPAALLLIKQVAIIFGFEINFNELETQIVSVVETVFLILALLGVANDPTTDGLTDSKQAMTYETPRKDED